MDIFLLHIFCVNLQAYNTKGTLQWVKIPTKPDACHHW